MTVGYIGSRDGQTYFWLLTDGDILVRCGCFLGKLDAFTEKVHETHAGTKYEKDYLAAIELAKQVLAG